MENITMTIDATHQSRVRSVCPEAGRVLLAGNRGWVRGTTVPAPAFFAAGFGATTKDLEFRLFGEPPV